MKPKPVDQSALGAVRPTVGFVFHSDLLADHQPHGSTFMGSGDDS